MKKILSALIFSWVLGQSGYALLPPLYQTANEIKAILESKELSQKLKSGEVIMTIQKNDEGYEIVTNKHRLQVDVSYLHQNRPGPSQFQFDFHQPSAPSS